jgi:hypothetical protein
MNTYTLVPALALIAALPLTAQDLRVGDTYQSITGNVTSTSPETVSLVIAKEIADGDLLARLVLEGANGRVIWRSPLAARMGDPGAYVIGNMGVAVLQVAGDFDGDGRREVVVEEPRSDVSPPRFRILRWNGSELTQVRSRRLIEAGNSRFVWTNEWDYLREGRWIEAFKRILSPGRCEVVIFSYRGPPSYEQQASLRIARATAKGFILE